MIEQVRAASLDLAMRLGKFCLAQSYATHRLPRWLHAKARSLRRAPIEQIWLVEIRNAGKPSPQGRTGSPFSQDTCSKQSGYTSRSLELSASCRLSRRTWGHSLADGHGASVLPGERFRSFFMRGAARGCAVAGALEHLSRVAATSDLGVHSCPAVGSARTLVNLPLAMLLLADLPAPVPPTGDDPNHCYKQRNKGYGCDVAAKCHRTFPNTPANHNVQAAARRS